MPIGVGHEKKASLLCTFDDNFDPVFFFAQAPAFWIRSVSHEKHQFGSYEQTCNGSNHMVSMWKTCELRIMGNGIALLLCKWEKWGTHTMKKNMENCTQKNNGGIVFFQKSLIFIESDISVSDSSQIPFRCWILLRSECIWEERIRLIHWIALFLLNFSSMWNQKHNHEFVWCHTKYLFMLAWGTS